MSYKTLDYLIIGQGLAGSMLSFELIKRGQRVLVVDNNLHGSSSQVAAGLINPITGHRLNMNDGFVDYLDIAQNLYTALENELGTSFISPIEQRRLIKNPGQASYFEKRCEQQEYRAFLSKANTPEFKSSEFGTAAVHQTYVVDTKALLAAVKTWLIERDAYLSVQVDYSDLVSEHQSFSINDINAKQIIFCEGFQAINNPWLKDLPFKFAKGEILTLELETACPTMLSWGSWLVPQEPNSTSAKLGANYAWEDTDLTPSEAVKTKLIDSLEQTTTFKGRVVQHEVGVRPTTKLRKAFVGPLSNLNNAYCFNGFGSKGCLTIPKHVQLLCDHLLLQTELPNEVTQCL
jgi:glycine/D-amino acid oxidase-like deaminating enzyme